MSVTDAVRSSSSTSARPVAPRRKVRLPWLLVAAGVFVLIVMLVLWAVSSASDRTQVLTIVEPVGAGEPIPDSAIGTVGVSNDGGFGRVYVESQRTELVGAIAVADLAPGDLLGPSMVTNAPDTAMGERLVGAVLRAGRYPEEIQRGDTGVAVSTLDRATAARRRCRYGWCRCRFRRPMRRRSRSLSRTWMRRWWRHGQAPMSWSW